MVCAARQTTLESTLQQNIMVTTNWHGFKINEARIFLTSRECTLDSRETTEISPKKPFYTLFRNVSNRKDRLSNTIKSVQNAEFPSFIHAIDSENRDVLAMEVQCQERVTNWTPLMGQLLNQPPTSQTYQQFNIKHWNSQILRFHKNRSKKPLTARA